MMERFFRRKQKAFFKGAPLRCAPALRAARKGISPAYPALSRSAPRRTRDESARAGLNNFAPSQKRTGLVHRKFRRLDSLSELRWATVTRPQCATSYKPNVCGGM